MKKLSNIEFIKKCKAVHGDKYIYDNCNYVNSRCKVNIICPVHGSFSINANNFLNGQGCVNCWKNNVVNSLSINTDLFIESANKVHGNKYDYSKTKYTRSYKKIIITCKEHGDFEQIANDHISGSGCKRCNCRGWERHKWISKSTGSSTLYLIKCWNDKELFYKIGITNKALKDRFCVDNKIPYNYESIREIMGSPEHIWGSEVELHKLCKNCRYVPDVKFSGYSECYTQEAIDYFRLYEKQININN